MYFAFKKTKNDKAFLAAISPLVKALGNDGFGAYPLSAYIESDFNLPKYGICIRRLTHYPESVVNNLIEACGKIQQKYL